MCVFKCMRVCLRECVYVGGGEGEVHMCVSWLGMKFYCIYCMYYTGKLYRYVNGVKPCCLALHTL